MKGQDVLIVMWTVDGMQKRFASGITYPVQAGDTVYLH